MDLTDEQFAELNRYIDERPRTYIMSLIDQIRARLRYIDSEKAYESILHLHKEGLISFAFGHALILAVRYPRAEVNYVESHKAVTPYYEKT